MKRALPRELNEEAVPAMVLHASERRLLELFPVDFSEVDPFAEAEPSQAALVRLESGLLVMVTYGTITHRATVSVPMSAHLRETIRALLRETAVRGDEVVWAAEPVRGVLATEATGRARMATVAVPERRTGAGARIAGLRNCSENELRARERELVEQLFKLRFQRATGRVRDPKKVRQVRREIAQIKSLLSLLSDREKVSS